MVAGVHTFIHKDISVEYDFQNTDPPTLSYFVYTTWPVLALVSAMSMMVPTLVSTWSLLLTTPGVTLPVSPPSLQLGSSSRARAETSNIQVREVLANMFLPREEFLDFILEIIFLSFWFFSV